MKEKPEPLPAHRRGWSRFLPWAWALLGVTILVVWASIWPADNALVGTTEVEVQNRYGRPKEEFVGHYGNPPLAWTHQFKGDVKSGVFRRLGGEIYVTFENRDGHWIVISNSYLPRGAAF